MASKRLVLKVLYDPKGTTPDVDLVLVHGLNGDPIGSWTRTFKTEDPDEPTISTCWPRDLLPTVLPRTRVLTLGYNGDIYLNQSTAGIRGNAESLLAQLKLRRRDPSRPIVLLGHCLGGLIVKQALRFANDRPEYKAIAAATHSILLFGTPHFGTDKNRWLSIANNLALMKVRQHESNEPSALVKAITRNSRDLAEISEDFCQIAPKYIIKSYYETRTWQKTNQQIVDKMSSLMFIDAEIAEAVDADHVAMCKFEDEDDATFLSVCAAIEAASLREAPRPPPQLQPTWTIQNGNYINATGTTRKSTVKMSAVVTIEEQHPVVEEDDVWEIDELYPVDTGVPGMRAIEGKPPVSAGVGTGMPWENDAGGDRRQPAYANVSVREVESSEDEMPVQEAMPEQDGPYVRRQKGGCVFQ
ncbi:hypothetical protein B0T19DRAFT_488965 [Cercophora scortea]|uniref:DUF676 domain-containing protein n=1 Tax=Cercophora scortea TaxID=314031 RepID=A0AAE0M3X5_9PEZI|nr:hypothetical protein B0T19DRAFT_488965 [Cercophora scortea]